MKEIHPIIPEAHSIKWPFFERNVGVILWVGLAIMMAIVVWALVKIGAEHDRKERQEFKTAPTTHYPTKTQEEFNALARDLRKQAISKLGTEERL